MAAVVRSRCKRCRRASATTGTRCGRAPPWQEGSNRRKKPARAVTAVESVHATMGHVRHNDASSFRVASPHGTSVFTPLPVLWLTAGHSAPVSNPQAELKSFLVEITAIIVNKKDDQAPGYLVDQIVDQTGSKGTGEQRAW